MNREEFMDKMSKKREEYKNLLETEPFEERRVKYKWRFVLDDNKKVLEKPTHINIDQITTKSLRKILDEKDYSNHSNQDIVLRTIWDEYHWRRSNGDL